MSTVRRDTPCGENPAPLSGAECVNPYGDTSAKGEQVERMFDTIAPAYDFMNTAMTLGLHRHWRDRALKWAAEVAGAVPGRILDVATGTGDVAFRMHSMWPGADITGIDLSAGMLDVARRRLEGMGEGPRARIRFAKEDCLALSMADSTFDLVTVAYGVRNFEHLEAGLREMARVTRPGGVVCIVELSRPVNPLALAGYRLYTRWLIPAVGRMVSGDSRAYTYLPESIAAAPQRDAMTALMGRAGLHDCRWRQLTLGAVCLYVGRKPR